MFMALVFSRLGAQTNTVYFEDWVKSGGSSPSQTQNELLERVATVTDANGNLFVASSTYNESTQVHDLLLEKSDNTGTLIWKNQFNITGGGDVFSGDLTLDANGSPVFTGAVLNGSNSYDALTVKFTDAGAVSWSKTWNGTANGYDGGVSVATDASGNIYVSGISTVSSVSRDFLTIKYTSGGTQSWVSQHDHAGLVDAAAKVTHDSGILRVFGGVQVNATTWALSYVRYNASTGAQISAGLISDNIVFNEINGFTTDASDNTYIAGARNSSSNDYDFLTLKLDASLAVSWEATWNGTNGKDVAKAIAVDASGNAYVTGYTTTSANGRDYATLKYNASGSLQWSKTYDGAAQLDDEATDLETDTSGNIFVTGFATEKGNEDYVTIWYDSNGNEKWVGRFNSVYNRKDKSASLTIDGEDALLVTGRTGKIETDGDLQTETTVVRYKKADLIIPPDPEETSKGIAYTKNNGQLLKSDLQPADEVKFYAYGFPQFYLQENIISYVISTFDGDTSTIDTTWRVDMSLGAERDLALVPLKARNDYSNYYLSHIPEGRERVLSFRQVVHLNAFSGIDLLLSSNRAGIKYDFIVKPGADPGDIDLYFDGQSSLSVDQSGELVVGTAIGNISFPEPRAFQIVNGEEIEMPWTPSYAVEGNNVSITTGSFDIDDPLVLRIKRNPEQVDCDPVANSGLEYSTYYGGSHNDGAYDMAPGVPTQAGQSGESRSGIGTAYITGETSSNNFPVLGQAVTSLQGASDAFVVAMQDLARLWSIYYGGNGGQSIGTSVGFDVGNKTVWVGGLTSSTELPVTAPDDFPFDDFIGTPPMPAQFWKGFMAKFNEDGFLIYSTYFGGEGQSRIHSLDIDINGHVFFGGKADSGLFPNELESNGDIYYQDPEGNGASFITEFDPVGQLVWSTEFAQENSELVDLDIDSDGNLVITGVVHFVPETVALDFVEQPGINDLFITDMDGESDVYIAKFNTQENQRQLIWSTLFTGPSLDHPWEVKTDSKNNIVLLGSTVGPTLHPDINVANSHNGCMDLFLAKFNPSGVIQKAIFHGGSGQDGSDRSNCNNPASSSFTWTRMGLAFDGWDNIYVTANSLSEDFPDLFSSGTYNQELLGNSSTNPGTGDATVIGFDVNLNPFWATYFGGMSEPNNWVFSGEHGTGIAIVANKLYVTGHTRSDCPVKLPLKDNPSANYYTEDMNLDQVHEQSPVPDAFITVFTLPDAPTDTDEPVNEGKKGIRLYPVPADQYLDIRVSETTSSFEVSVFNIIGEKLYGKALPLSPSGTFSVSTGHLPDGVYFLVIKGNGIHLSEKFIVHHP